jgi:hypothetical protein
VTILDPDAEVPPVEGGHISYSAYTDYRDCGKYYQLKRLMSLPEQPAWWNVGGSAVHAATEAFDHYFFAQYQR